MRRGLLFIGTLALAAPAHAAGLLASPLADDLSIFALGVGGLIIGWRSSRSTSVRRDDDA